MIKLNRAVLVAVLALAACATSGKQVTDDQLTGFQPGVTTYDQVVAKLGKPTGTFVNSDGSRGITYTYVHSQVRAASFIPVVGIFAGGADTQHNMVSMSFDKSGLLKSYTSSAGGIGVGTGLVSGQAQ